MNKLGFTEKQIGRMTVGKWALLYEAYKDNFDLEMKMQQKNIGYSELAKRQETSIDDVIPF